MVAWLARKNIIFCSAESWKRVAGNTVLFRRVSPASPARVIATERNDEISTFFRLGDVLIETRDTGKLSHARNAVSDGKPM